MYKNIISILFFLSMVLPTILSAAALPRYSVPSQQQSGYDANEHRDYVSERVYENFRREIRDYSPAQIDDLKNHFNTLKRDAEREGNDAEELYYRRLIDILDSSK